MNPYLADRDLTLYVGDVLETLRELPDGSVDCCVTSPPYWGLRDYSVDGQIGLEATPDLFVAKMVDVFREVRRVLAAHGTCWVNLGDSYASGEVGRHGGLGAAGIVEAPRTTRGRPEGLKPKDLVGIPWRVAFALQADGWWLRSDIIWSKPNPMPESVTDRPTKAHEYVFLLTRQPRYWFDAEAVREPAQYGFSVTTGVRNSNEKWKASVGNADAPPTRQSNTVTPGDGTGGRNVRSVWEIATQPYPEAHFATFPEELPRRAIAAGCPLAVCRALVCEKCGVAHPAATVESLWDVETETEAHTGGTQAVSERDAVQAELRRVRDVLREQESARLLTEMQRDQSDLDAGHEAEGRSDQSPWLHPPLDARLPLGYDREGLRVGAPLRDGATPGTEAGASREGSSPERGQGGQPPVESVDRDALDAPWRGRVPGLRDALLRSLTCSACGSSGFRVCGKPRERIVERETNWQERREAGAWAGNVGVAEDYQNNVHGRGMSHDLGGGAVRDLGWSDCGHNNYRPGVVLDPFAGAGTTLLVARKLGRASIGIELNPEYAELIAKRTRQLSLLAEEPAA